MIIDIHIHYCEEEGYLERLLKECDRVKIDKICLSTAGAFYGHVENLKIKDAFKKYPDRVIGFGYVALGKDEPSMVDRLQADGFRGLKVINPSANYDDKKFYPIYFKAEKYNMPILFHTGVVARTENDHQANISSARMRPVYLDTIARAFPKLTLIGAHLGVPWHAEACTIARMNPNIYFDLTGSPYGGWREVITSNDLKRLFFWKGAFEKVLFGTDVKIEHLERAVKIYQEMLGPLNLSQDVLDKIYGKTLVKILGLKH